MMIGKKDLVIAVLATFCLTATLFLIIPTRSQPDRYDSWLDVNDDGKIDIIDIFAEAKAFGSTGDPAKPVNVTNWPTQQPEPSYRVEFYKGFQMSWPQLNWSVSTPNWELYSGGYDKAIIYMRWTHIGPWPPGAGRTTIYLNYIQWYGSTQGGNDPLGSTTLSENDLNVTMPGSADPQNGPLEVETKGPYFTLQFAVDSTYDVAGSETFDLSVYFRN